MMGGVPEKRRNMDVINPRGPHGTSKIAWNTKMFARATAALITSVILTVLVCAGCRPQEKHFWFTHCEGPEFRDVSLDRSYGTSPPGEIVKVTDQLILAPPKAYFPHYFGDDPKRPECKSTSDLPRVTAASFSFRASTLHAIPIRELKEGFDPDAVYVTITWQTQELDYANQEEYFARENGKPDLRWPGMKEAVESGLRCYGKGPCYGSTVNGGSPDVLLNVIGANVGVIAEYYSPKYGGIEIGWTTSGANISQWKPIATQIYAYLDGWNALRPDFSSKQCHDIPIFDRKS